MIRRTASGPGLTLAVLTVAILAACTSPTPSPAPEPTGPAPSVTEPEPEPWVSLIATVDGDSVDVFDSAGSPSPSVTLDAADVVSHPDATPLTLLVLDGEQRTDREDQPPGPRLRVLLPGAVDGTDSAADADVLDLPTGWVREADVTVATTDLRLEVRLGDGRLLLHRADDVVLDVPVGLGPAAPRPGRTFLTELVTPPSADGPYGGYAYGLAGYPTALAGFGSADGLVGIHAGAGDADAAPPDPGSGDPGIAQPGSADPGDPSSGGGDLGSVRLTDADMTRLVTELGLPLGTPVDVVA